MDAHDTGDCSWVSNPLFFSCDKEYCLGVTCNDDKQVEDFQACAECSEGYEFAAPSTSHTYLEIKIGELCDNTGKCPAGYRKGNIHRTSAGICNAKLKFGHNDQHTYDCEKQTTRTIVSVCRKVCSCLRFAFCRVGVAYEYRDAMSNAVNDACSGGPSAAPLGMLMHCNNYIINIVPAALTFHRHRLRTSAGSSPCFATQGSTWRTVPA